MPDNVVNVSFTNINGNTVVLDDSARSFVGELYGRTGCEMPTLKYEEITYADGSTEIAAVTMEPRDVTLFFWAPVKNVPLEQQLTLIKQRLLQTGFRVGNWGTLRIRRKNGTVAELNCVYTGGIDETVRTSWSWVKFAVTFRASDPLFYDQDTASIVLTTWSEWDYLNFRDTTFFGSGTHFRNSANTISPEIVLDCYRVYPEITITGPAENVLLRNETTDREISFLPSFKLYAGDRVFIRLSPLEKSCTVTRADGREENGLKYITAETTLDWFLISGTNRLSYRNSNNNTVSTCKLAYKKGWLSAE